VRAEREGGARVGVGGEQGEAAAAVDEQAEDALLDAVVVDDDVVRIRGDRRGRAIAEPVDGAL
jgi:hypothetical protein